MKPPVHDASTRQLSGQPSSGLGPNGAGKDRLRNRDLAELDSEITGLVDRPPRRLRFTRARTCDEVLMSIPFAEADLHERNLKLRVFECMMKAGLQFTRDRERANARNKVLERLAAALRADKQDVS